VMDVGARMQAHRRAARNGARVFSVGTLPRRLANVFLPTGALWLFGAGALLVISLFTPWLQVPLVNTWTSWELPIDLGWGVKSDAITYGMLVSILALCFFWQGVRVADWPALAPLGNRSGAVMRPRRLIWMSLLALSPALLALFQLLFVDYSLMATLQDNENQYLLLTRHLGYRVASQHFSLQVLHFSISGVGNRFYLIVELAALGAIAPLLACLLCLIGAYFSRSAVLPALALPAHGSIAAPRSSSARPTGDEADRSHGADGLPDGLSDELLDKQPAEQVEDAVDWRRWRGLLFAAAVVVGLLIFGRAPAGLYAKSLGLAALNQGHYQAALNDFAIATTLTPSLNDLPHFREERGQALYMLGDTDTLDGGIYLAAQYTTIGVPDQAWAVERELLRRYPTSVPLKQITTNTLAFLIESNTRVAITPTDNEEEALNPEVVIQVAQVDEALPWLDRLLQVQPTNVYALYMHGRVLYSARSYESAGSDFLALAHESRDANLQSAAYTYVALCYGGLNDFTAERSYLQLAVELDYDYNNTTARTSASGLH